MDLFGTGSAMKGMVRMYRQTARATGRTTSMLDNLKDGDRIIFANPNEADRVSHLCRQRDLQVTCCVIPPNNPSRLSEHGKSRGRTVFDHTWVEKYYMDAVKRAGNDIDHFELHLSGHEGPYRDSERQETMKSNWKEF